MLKERARWWGVSFAFVPTLVGAVGVSYSGMAGINAAWHLLFNRDAPGLLMVLGGIVYGGSVGVLLPCFLFGAAAHLMWQLTSHRLAPVLSRASLPAKAAGWMGLQLVTLPISLCLTFAAYGLPWLFLGAG
jgi:hypothetical protein